jgi:hypothetical protein
MGSWIGLIIVALVAYSLSGWGVDWVIAGLFVCSGAMMLVKQKET